MNKVLCSITGKVTVPPAAPSLTSLTSPTQTYPAAASLTTCGPWQGGWWCVTPAPCGRGPAGPGWAPDWPWPGSGRPPWCLSAKPETWWCAAAWRRLTAPGWDPGTRPTRPSSELTAEAPSGCCRGEGGTVSSMRGSEEGYRYRKGNNEMSTRR